MLSSLPPKILAISTQAIVAEFERKPVQATFP
jgi:hypothetical protein